MTKEGNSVHDENQTIFGKVIRREVPAQIVFENDLVLAFRDIAPQAPTHIVIIPKEYIPTLNDVDEQDRLVLGELFVVANKIAQQEGCCKDGYRLVMNVGQDGGQTVFHLHMHLLAGRSLTWPPG